MTLEIVIPEKNLKKSNIKDLIFSILIEDTEKTLTQLHREIKKKYGVSVSFQAIIKAVKSLLLQKVLKKHERLYSLNKDWIFETRNFLDQIYTEHFKVKKPIKKIELGKEVIVYTVHNLLELDRLWNDLLTNWIKNEKKDKRNVWKGKHCWWLIPRLQEEDILHDFLLKNKIETYNIISENTILDKISLKYYSDKGEFIKSNKRTKLEKNMNISAFGKIILKFEIPKKISKKIESIYKKTKKIEDINLKKVLDIFKENTEIEITLIKDKYLADKIKEEIIDYFK